MNVAVTTRFAFGSLLAGALSGAATAAVERWREPELSWWDVVPTALAGGVPVLVAGALLGVWVARSLNHAAERVARAERPEEIDVRAAGWSAPLVSSARGAIERWARRCDALESQQRESEVRLKLADAERAHAESILNSLRDAVVVTDQFNEVTLANSSALRLLGGDASRAVHSSVDALIPDESLRRMIKDVMEAGVVSRQKRAEHAMTTPDRGGNSAFDVTITCLPDRRTGEGAGGVVTILRDITREKEISQMKSDFVSQASHELRTPLASINAYVEMLIDGEAGEEQARQEFYLVIKAEVDRVSRMIDNMLNISRIEAGIVSVERAEVDFAKMVRGVLETMQPQAAAKKIMLVDKIGPLIYTAEADRDMMHQVVMNLVSNAIKYTPEGGRVTVTVENDDASRSVLVVVQDTGLGIPPDALKRLFEKFFRIESYKRIAKGTGLGLNLVKHIVETVHHGKVGVTSEVGMGSKFWFTVPYEFQGGQE